MATTIDKLVDRFKVKVYRLDDDSRTKLCGEPLTRMGSKEHDGDEGGDYFIIPAHQADYINSMFPKYQISEPYIPGVDTEKLIIKEKPKREEDEEKK